MKSFFLFSFTPRIDNGVRAEAIRTLTKYLFLLLLFLFYFTIINFLYISYVMSLNWSNRLLNVDNSNLLLVFFLCIFGGMEVNDIVVLVIINVKVNPPVLV